MECESMLHVPYLIKLFKLFSNSFIEFYSGEVLLSDTSSAKAMKVLRKLGYYFQIQVGLYRTCVKMVIIKLFRLFKFRKLLNQSWSY